MQQFPKCKCGQEVHTEDYFVPCYDDGGGLDSFDVELEIYDRCIDCLRQSDVEYESVVHRHEVWRKRQEETDDLPF
jgi:cytolysin (calcineurin-like family phosphatase)